MAAINCASSFGNYTPQGPFIALLLAVLDAPARI